MTVRGLVAPLSPINASAPNMVCISRTLWGYARETLRVCAAALWRDLRCCGT